MIEQQIAALVAIGYSVADATDAVGAALAMLPPGADLTTWVPSPESLDDGVTMADVTAARNNWYATAPDEWARILDATEAAPDA